MTPFGSEPGVIEIKPTDHGADIESRLDRVELELRTRHFRTVRHHRARHYRSQQLGASRIFERFEAATERVDQAVARGLIGDVRFDFVFGDVVDDVDDDLIPFGADVRNVCGHVDFLC